MIKPIYLNERKVLVLLKISTNVFGRIFTFQDPPQICQTVRENYCYSRGIIKGQTDKITNYS